MSSVITKRPFFHVFVKIVTVKLILNFFSSKWFCYLWHLLMELFGIMLHTVSKLDSLQATGKWIISLAEIPFGENYIDLLRSLVNELITMQNSMIDFSILTSLYFVANSLYPLHTPSTSHACYFSPSGFHMIGANNYFYCCKTPSCVFCLCMVLWFLTLVQ
ncbi:hypothetical protein AMTRI_Chr07g77190 [Amborella trichopoda]